MPELEHAIRHLQTPERDPLRAASAVDLRLSEPSSDPISYSIPIVPSTAQFNEFYR